MVQAMLDNPLNVGQVRLANCSAILLFLDKEIASSTKAANEA